MKIIKNYLLKAPLVFELNAYLKDKRLKNYYRALRDHYSKEADVRFDDLIKSKIKQFKIKFSYKNDLNILFYYCGNSWLEPHLVPSLKKFGSLETLIFIDKPIMTKDEVEKNGNQLLRKLKDDSSYDVIIIGGAEGHISHDCLNRIMEEYHIPIINFHFDSKQNFFRKENGLEIGSIEAAKGSLLTFTNAKYSVEWYLKEGCPAVYLPEASNPEIYFPDKQVKKDIDVGFFGAKYGKRINLVKYLTKHGINVQCFGAGWKTGFLSFNEQNRLIQKTKIIISHEGIGYSYWPSHLKGKTFDFTMAGACVLTSYSSELPDWFILNKEILCYYNFDDALDIIKYYLNNEELIYEFGQAAFERAIKEHTWPDRFKRVFRILETYGN